MRETTTGTAAPGGPVEPVEPVVAPGRGGLVAALRDPRLSRYGWPLLVVLVVVAANFPALIGLVNVNPLGPVGATALHVKGGFLAGLWYDDPEIGYTAQALGHLSAMDWLHGIIPWWNPYEGLGSPLAGEMQAASFFPPTLLLALSQGQLYFHMVLEAAGGLGTYFLARELGFLRPIATVGGALFALNGTFAWFGHAAMNPVALLPFTLLGVERIFRRSAADNAGWLILAFALALSFYAGFPETTYLDGLFAALWVVIRLICRPAAGRGRYIGKVVLGGVVGGLLAAPLIIAFADYLPNAYVGAHSGSLGTTHALANAAEAIGLPYLYGNLLEATTPHGTLAIQGWQMFGGFTTASIIFLAFVGVMASRREWFIRAFLALGTLLILCWTFFIGPAHSLFEKIVPLAGKVWVSRYSEPSWELALILLACFGLEAILTARKHLWAWTTGAAAAALGVLGIVLYATRHALRDITEGSTLHVHDAVEMVAWAGGLVVVMALVAIAVRLGRRRVHTSFPKERLATSLIGTLALLDAGVMFMMPLLTAPRSETVDSGPADYLVAHLGSSRFFGYGVYRPDYGAYYGIAALDSNDSPVPKLWSTYIKGHLAPNTSAIYFGTHSSGNSAPSPAQSVVLNMQNYEALGVRYVMLKPSDHAFGRPGNLVGGVQLVYSDQLADIYELPSPRGFFYTEGSSCTLQPQGTQQVKATCSGPATLVRNEIYFPGWAATVNGRSVSLGEAAGVLESVQLPAGTSTVTFSYLPKHETIGLSMFVAGALCVLGIPVGTRLWRKRRQPVASPEAGEGESTTNGRADAEPEV